MLEFQGLVIMISALLALTLLILGILCMPMAALWCGIIARRQSLNTWWYAVKGASYSAMLFLPWVYLMLRMQSKSLPLILGVIAYALLYIAWFYTCIFWLFLSVVGKIVGGFVNIDASQFGILSGNEAIAISITLSVNALLWTTSLGRLLRRYWAGRQSNRALTDDVIDSAYTRPFRYFMLSLVMTVVVYAVMIHFDYN